MMKNIIITFLFVIISTLSNAQSQKTLFDVASEKANKYNYAEAIIDLNRYIKLNPSHLPSLILRAKCYNIESDYKHSIEDYLLIIKLDKEAKNEEKANYFENLGFAHSMLDEYSKARNYYREANNLTPNYYNIISNIGYTFKKEKLYDSAIVYFDKALQIDKSHVFSIRNKIQSLKALDKDDEALALSDEFLLTKKFDIDIALTRASILISKEKFAEALSDYQRALIYEPEEYLALFGVSRCYVELGYYEEDLKLKQRIVQILKANKESNSMVANSLALLGSAYKYSGDYLNAIIAFDESEALNPKDASVILERSLTKALNKDLEGACNDLRKARTIDEEKANEYEEFITENSEFEELVQYCLPN